MNPRPGSPGTPLIVVSNREPFVHQRDEAGGIRVVAPAGGLTSALQPLLTSTGGTWIAWGSGAADFEVTGPDDSLGVPPDRPAYRLRRLRLSTEEVGAYYGAIANRSLWPLCHSQLQHFRFEAEDWAVFRQVNRRFAEAAIDEARARPATVWVQDYHLALVPGMLRGARGLFIHHFWHIPWPSPDILRMLPRARALVNGLLGNHLLAFQTPRDVRNFLMSARRFVPAAVIDVRRRGVRVGGRETAVRAFPISIDVEAWRALASRPSVEERARRVRRVALPPNGGGHLLLGVDRIDYTKGIPRRFEAYRRLLQAHPELRRRVTLYQIGVPSRTDVPEFAAFEGEVVALAESINRDWGEGDWRPIHLVRENLDPASLAACYRAADVCLVTSLQDGMNLIAKEYVACQQGRLGVLVLSRFAGSSRELRGAVLVNPYDISAVARATAMALSLPPDERERRLTRMRQGLEAHTVYDWMTAIFKEVARLSR
jgi:trehalose 6-phosphate synthase